MRVVHRRRDRRRGSSVVPHADESAARSVIQQATKLIGPADHTDRIRVAVPVGMEDLAAAWEAALPGRVQRHDDTSTRAKNGQPFWCAADEFGVIRSVGVWHARSQQLHRLRTLLHRTRRW